MCLIVEVGSNDGAIVGEKLCFHFTLSRNIEDFESLVQRSATFTIKRAILLPFQPKKSVWRHKTYLSLMMKVHNFKHLN